VTSNSTKIGKLSMAFRETREEMGIDIKKMANDLGIQLSVLEAIEALDWSDIPSDKAYELSVAIAGRLGLDLDNFYVDRAFFFGDINERDTRPRDMRRERAVMVTMTTATVAVLCWLLIPANDISVVAAKESPVSALHGNAWKRPPSDVTYPVLGEVFPESPITNGGALVSLRATDTCGARIIMEKGQELEQTLRMSEPWKLRVKGAFTLHLDNAGVVAAEVAGVKIPHGTSVGQQWSGAFDDHGYWLQPKKPTKNAFDPLSGAKPSADRASGGGEQKTEDPADGGE
jgi:transcriptional regulator with XRE-family HTH domain